MGGDFADSIARLAVKQINVLGTDHNINCIDCLLHSILST